MLTNSSHMNDVIHELLIADQAAGMEFVQRQALANLPVLGAAGKLLAREVWSAQWSNADAMRQHKDPDPLPRLSRERFQALLDAAVLGDHAAIATGLNGLTLDELSTLASIGYLLSMAVDQRRNELARLQRAQAADAQHRGLVFPENGVQP